MSTINRPLAAKWISGIIIFKSILLIIYILLFEYALFSYPTEGFLSGIVDSGVGKINIENPFENISYTAGYFLGKYGAMLILLLLQLYAFNKRKKLLFWIAWAIDLLALIGTGGLPIFSLIILILGLTKKVRLYLNQENT